MTRTRSTQWLWAVLWMCCGLLLPQPSQADDSAESHSGPWVGGHVGIAIQLAEISKDSKIIGDDFGTIGLAPGITVHLSDRWAIDFETVAYSDYANSSSFFVVDPGLLYKFDRLALGIRAAVNTRSFDNWGFIPIINKGWSVGLIKLFVELDLPIFITDGEASMVVQPQLGVAF